MESFISITLKDFNIQEDIMHIIYGYIRVSSKDQNEDRQLLAMQELSIAEDKIFIDKQSGKDFDRHM